MSDAETLKTTPLTQAHVAAGGRMVPFAGYSMPVQYPEGVLAEHRWTREHAGAFDVSHMGPAFLRLRERIGNGDADHRAVSALIEPLVSGDIAGLKPGQLRYTLLLNADGGIVDDLMVGRPLREDRQGQLYIVVNAGTKEADFAQIEAASGAAAELIRADDRALVALQGPEAADVLGAIIPEAPQMSFMTHRRVEHDGHGLVVSRSGYTGEDGYEILVPPDGAGAFWDALLSNAKVKAIGLGARDSLRLEAGLPLYGHDLDETVSPIEASLSFAVNKVRRDRGDLRGADRLARERAGALSRVRVGLKVKGAPAREGAEIADASGAVVGRVTSGGPSPTLGLNIAMGYVPPAHAALGTALQVLVRGKPQSAEVVAMPFVDHRYVRKGLA